MGRFTTPTVLCLAASSRMRRPLRNEWRYTLFPNGPDRLWYAAQLVVIGGLLWLVFGLTLQVLGSSLAGVVRSTRARLRHEPAGDEQPVSSEESS